jgi:peptidoglycan/xylan/chitin deacetylase (PgdA/CDA1 family)
MERLVLSAFLIASLAAAAHAGVDRPPQFVAIAFDNCTELERWQEFSDFAAEMNRNADRVHFTFFVSGINFIPDADRKSYQGPRQRPGASMINFGGTPEAVRRRIEYANVLRGRGHEIASHAVGHFNGAGWSAAEWAAEFAAYQEILQRVGLLAPVAGFRAPYLATSPGLYAVLKERGFRYDASRTAEAGEWPKQIDGIWRFNLVGLRLRGSGRSVLSMDYNFFVAHSRAVNDPQRQSLFRDQMLETYLEYFKRNYAGNRAPLHIGHHFANYQGGAYRQALISFARTVCGLPEVRCVTYSKLADFMDGLEPTILEAYRKGDFPHAGPPSLDIAHTALQQ